MFPASGISPIFHQQPGHSRSRSNQRIQRRFRQIKTSVVLLQPATDVPQQLLAKMRSVKRKQSPHRAANAEGGGIALAQLLHHQLVLSVGDTGTARHALKSAIVASA